MVAGARALVWTFPSPRGDLGVGKIVAAELVVGLGRYAEIPTRLYHELLDPVGPLTALGEWAMSVLLGRVYWAVVEFGLLTAPPDERIMVLLVA